VKRLAVSAVVIGVVLSGAVPASASTAWRVQAVPKPPGSTLLQGVSCPVRGDCTAVGFSVYHGNQHALAEHWDGSSWAIEPVPHPAGALQTILYGVSCISATSCTAVGTYYPQPTPGLGYQPLAEHWDGTRWTIQLTPIPAGAPQAQLYGVSCASATSCTAVGFYYVGAGGKSGPLGEHWNGTRWAIQPVPLPPLASDAQLEGVSCPTASDCTAVGEYTLLNNTFPFAARWTGTRWTSQVLPHPAGTYFLLLAVSCWQPGRCAAVGGSFNGSTGQPETSVVERQTGTSWTLRQDAAPAHTTLYGVACPSAQSCTAVGGDVLAWPPPSPGTTVAEYWDGTSWALQAAPPPPGVYGAAMSGVSCLAPAYCTAVGAYVMPGSHIGQPLAEHEG
jgi:hypothetical protein